MSALALSETNGPIYYTLFLEYLDKQNKEALEDFCYLCLVRNSADDVIAFLAGNTEELQDSIDSFLEKFYSFAVRRVYLKPRFLKAIMKLIRTPKMNAQQLANMSGCSIEAANALFSFMERAQD